MLVEIAPVPTVALEAHRVVTLPVLVLELHSRCNCRCVMCDIWKRAEHRELSLAALEQQRDTLRELGVQWVVLSGGEPLLNTSFVPICRFLRSQGIRVTLLTAGLQLSRRANDVAYNVDDVIVSLDGPRDVHDHIRGVRGAFQHLVDGVLSLLSLRPEMRISARTTVQRLNHRSLRATVEAAQDLDLSAISFLAADLTSAAFNRQEGWDKEHESHIALTLEETDRLEHEVKELSNHFAKEIASGYIAESESKLMRIVHHFRSHLGLEPPVAPLCNAPWVSAVVDHEGSVQPCFFHRSVGNLRSQTLGEIVNGVPALSFRASLDVERNPVCQRCVCSLNRRES